MPLVCLAFYFLVRFIKLWDVAYTFSSLTKKSMSSNHLHLLPSYFKTLRLSTAWNRIPASPSEVWNLTNWANQSAVRPNHVCLLVFLFGLVMFLCLTWSFVCPLSPSSIQREHESLNNHRLSLKWFHLFLPTLPKQFHVFFPRRKHLMYRQMQIVLLTMCSFFSIF